MNDAEEMFKMGWFVDAYNNNDIDYRIWNTGKKKGTIVLPTGAGKSGLVYANIVKHINMSKDGEKIIFNISAPILKLEAQLLNDFFACVKKIFANRVANGEFMFFINSSADGKAYDEVENLNADIQGFYDIGKFKASTNAKFAIVASCHKSLYKFAEKIDELNSYAKVITYLDEAHLVVNETRDDKTENELNADSKVRWESLKELCKGEYVYALTATPDKQITKLINTFAGEEYDYHIIDVPARELIKENKILPVLSEIAKVPNGESEKINKDVCINFMNRVIESNPLIHHKVLVTCSSSEHLVKLRNELSANYKVFSTCCREGGMTTDENGEKDIDEVKFIKEVDSYDGNCFVLHIKQLIQGIDIKTLTDCIIYNSTRLNDGVKRTILQTVGRILRPLFGERGMPIELRKKKCGNVLFLIGEEDFDAVKSQYLGFLLKYYGQDGIKAFSKDINTDGNVKGIHKNLFDNGSSGFGDEYYDAFEIEINKLLVEIEKFVTERVYPRWKVLNKAFKQTNRPYFEKSYIDNELKRVKEVFSKYGDGKEYDTCDLLSDTYLMQAISDVFKKVEIGDVED